MSDVTYSTFAAFRSAAEERGFFARVSGMLYRMRLRRSTSRALRDLDNHMLEDIGLTRGQLDRMLQSNWTI